LFKTLAFLFLLVSLQWADTRPGKVVGVTDGDTVELLVDGRPFKVRLHGVDTPEDGQPFGSRAKQFTSTLAFGKEVRADILDTDHYGRLVALVHLPDGRCLNHELVRHGFAWWYRDYAPGDSLLMTLESQAREAGVGLWAEANPVAPWDWRKGKRERRVEGPGGPRGPPVQVGPEGKPKLGAGPEGGANQGALAGEIVYRTRTGKKYHRVGCHYLKSKMT
jgi:endonuclease YncB( thermonuclease family)